MGADDVHYETRTAQTLRGLETRTQAKWEGEGWELVERADAPMLRTRLTFRRVKQRTPLWILLAGGAVAASLVTGIFVGSRLDGDAEPAVAATTPSAITAAAEPIAQATPSGSPSAAPKSMASASLEPAKDPVTRKEVVAAFRSYFAERAAANVMVGKAVTKVTFKRKVVRVTFDPAAADVSQEGFDEFKGFDNLAKFAATPIAFADETGNRLRPAIDSIMTMTPTGKSLGAFSRADILALNELTE